jgi:pyridine nucleotide-disulfide oxidoreductase family protein
MTRNRRVVLAGGGHAHLAVLDDWARQRLPGTECLLVTSSRYTAYSGMLPGWLAGFYRARDLFIDLKPLAEKSGVRLVLDDVVGLDAASRTLTLASGEKLESDVLSLATGGEIDVSALAALGEKLLPVRPVGAFMERWSALLERTTLRSNIHVCVVGGGAAGVELALGACASLRRVFMQARVSIVAPDGGFLDGHTESVRRRALSEIAGRGISVHYAHAVGEENGLLLSTGAFLPADCVIAATGSRAPSWLAKSGLACSSDGFVAIGSDLRSISHGTVFAAGDMVNRVDRNLERSGVHAVKSGPVLAANIRAALSGGEIRHYNPCRRTLYLLATGDRRAILSWGRIATSGKFAWRLKDWIDRYFVGRYTTAHGDRG